MSGDHQWRRFVADDEVPEQTQAFTNPHFVATMFLQALDEDPIRFNTALKRLTTPESHPAWGDFTAIAAALLPIEVRAYGSQPKPAVDAPDVVYFSIVRNDGPPYQVLDDEIINANAVLTLVWRPEHGSWLVHHYGQYVHPDEVPRTAPPQAVPPMK